MDQINLRKNLIDNLFFAIIRTYVQYFQNSQNLMSTSLDHLQNLFNFTDADLNANRRGKLSSEQLAFLQNKAQHDVKLVLIIPFIIIIGTLSLLNFWLALPSIIVITLIMIGLYGFYQMQIETLADEKVVKLSGYVTRVPRTSTITHFAVQVEDEVFVIDRDIYYQVAEGEYTLYVLENNRLILGIEPNSKKKSTRQTTKRRTSKSTTKSTSKQSTRKSSQRNVKTKSTPTKDKPAQPKYKRRTKAG